MNYAVIIGCNDYPNEPVLGTLTSAVSDAQELEKCLRQYDRGHFGNNIELFTREPSHEIMKTIYRYLEEADSDDMVFIYFSGHGMLDDKLGLHLCTSDTELKSLPVTSISATQLKDFMDNSNSTKIVCILDCCYSGGIGGFKGSSVGVELQRFTEGAGKYLLTASSKFQQVPDKGALMKYLLEGIRGAASSSREGMVTVEEIFDYVQKKVKVSGQRPLKFVSESAGDFYFMETDSKEEEMSPYVLGGRENIKLSFTNFPALLKDYCYEVDEENKEDKKSKTDNINFTFVIGSGRCKVADHTSYGTDAVLLPEVVNALKNWIKDAKDAKDVMDVMVSSCLDIDIFRSQDLYNNNLVIVGSGKVNLLTMEIQQIFRRGLKVRFPYPGSGDIIADCGPGKSRRYEAETETRGSNEGLLTLMRNPWAEEKGKKRVIILIAGSHPIGTIAAMRLLTDYIRNPRLGQNNYNDNQVPAKIVRGERIKDSAYAKRYPEILPSPRNTPTYIGNIKGYKILE